MSIDARARADVAIRSFEQSSRELIAAIENLSDEAAARKADPETWNAAQIGTHVAITNELFTNVFNGTMPMAQPAGEGFEETFSFDAIPSKLKTFPMLEPPAVVTRAAAADRLCATTDQLARTMKELPAEKWRYTVQLPFGLLSMTQFAEFAAAHTRRHQGQLNRLLDF